MFNIDDGFGYDETEALFTKFSNFLGRATTCNSLFKESSSGPSSSSSTSSLSRKRHVILLEDLPNILHQGTQSQFHDALRSLVEQPSGAPIVVIVSDAGLRGEASDEMGNIGELSGSQRWSKDRDSAVDVRTALPRDLLGGPYVTKIAFNPIAPTLMKKGLQGMLSKQFASSSTYSNTGPPSKEVLDIIVESSNGDIRSAVMALQFACIIDMPEKGHTKKKKAQGEGGKGGAAKVVVEAVTRREQSLALFHLIGKVMYNKRKAPLYVQGNFRF